MRQLLKLLLAAGSLAACQGLLGIEEATLRQETGGTSGRGGGSGAGGAPSQAGEGAAVAGAAGEAASEGRFSYLPIIESPIGYMAVGADGNFWFERDTLSESYMVSATTDWETTEFVTPLGYSIWDTKLGPDDNIWYARPPDKLGRVTRSGQINEIMTSAEANAEMLCAGPDGNLWFVGRSTFGNVTVDGMVVEYAAPPAGDLAGCTAGDDGNIWLTDRGQSAIISVAPSGEIIDSWPTPTRDASPSDLVSGPDGQVWFIEAIPNKVAKIEVSGVYLGRITEYTLPAGGTPSAIAAGPDGALWVTELQTNQLVRITTGGEVTSYDLPAGLAVSGAVVAGSDGNIWFAAGGNLVRFELE